MPFVGFDQGRLSTGILKDLGADIARRLGRQVDYLSAPPRRVPAMLAAGEADGLCYVARNWIDGDFHWSPPLMHMERVVAGRPQSPPVARVADLAGQTIGTVIGYRYPEIERELGPRFIRDEAPNPPATLRKLAIGRSSYALVERLSLDHHNQRHPHDGLRVLLTVAHFEAHCAFTRARDLPLDEIDRAVAAMVKDGTVDRILRNYQ